MTIKIPKFSVTQYYTCYANIRNGKNKKMVIKTYLKGNNNTQKKILYALSGLSFLILAHFVVHTGVPPHFHKLVQKICHAN